MAEFRMPSLGADMEYGTLLEWLVEPGDNVTKGDIVAVVDTDKSAVEAESFSSGTVGDLVVEPGTRVPVGTVLATIVEPGAVAPHGPAAAPSPPPLRASPPVRQVATRLGVDLATVQGTGRGGAVTRADVQREASGRHVELRRPRVTPYARRLAAELGLDLAAVRPGGTDEVVRAVDVRGAVSRPLRRRSDRRPPRPGCRQRFPCRQKPRRRQRFPCRQKPRRRQRRPGRRSARPPCALRSHGP